MVTPWLTVKLVSEVKWANANASTKVTPLPIVTLVIDEQFMKA
jgi:hypothetical protein